MVPLSLLVFSFHVVILFQYFSPVCFAVVFVLLLFCFFYLSLGPAMIMADSEILPGHFSPFVVLSPGASVGCNQLTPGGLGCEVDLG